MLATFFVKMVNRFSRNLRLFIIAIFSSLKVVIQGFSFENEQHNSRRIYHYDGVNDMLRIQHMIKK